MKSPKVIYTVALTIALVAIVTIIRIRWMEKHSILPQYTVIDLGEFSSAEYIAKDGSIAGTALFAIGGDTRAYIYKNGERRFINPLLGYKYSYASSLNDAGDVVGQAQKADSLDNRAFLWKAGKLTDLGTLGGKTSQSMHINNKGQIVGQAETLEGQFHAFVWQQGKMQDLGTLGGLESSAYGINDLGGIVGSSDTGKSKGRHAFLWQNGHMRDMGWEEGDLASPFADIDHGAATAINNRGQIVGCRNHQAILWDNGTLKDLGRLNIFSGESYALAINDTGDIVGTSTSSENDPTAELPSLMPHAFLYRKGEMSDLNDLIPPKTGWVLWRATSINDNGQIVGVGRLGTVDHAFLLQPMSNRVKN